MDTVALDIGASRIRCVKIRKERNEFPELLSCAEVPSAGWMSGSVVDVPAFRDAVSSALAKCRFDGTALVCGIGGIFVESSPSSWSEESPRKRQFSRQDFEYAAALSRGILPRERSRLTFASPRWVVDGREVHPGKIEGKQLGFQGVQMSAPSRDVRVLQQALEDLHPKSSILVFEALASSFSAMTTEERSGNAIVVDIGAQSTGMVVWHQGCPS